MLNAGVDGGAVHGEGGWLRPGRGRWFRCRVRLRAWEGWRRGRSGRGVAVLRRGCEGLRFAFHGRVSTEDWQEYERACYGSQYAMVAPLLQHYGVQLWMPEAGGRVNFASEHDEHAMTTLGLSSKREIARTSIRVRTAMAAQASEQGRYLGGRPPYGYRLGDAGPHPNKAHAAWGRRAHRLEPNPETEHVVRWIFAQRLAGHSIARITRALNEAGIPCPGDNPACPETGEYGELLCPRTKAYQLGMLAMSL